MDRGAGTAGRASLKALGSNWEAITPAEQGKLRIQDTLEPRRQLPLNTMKCHHAAEFQKAAQPQH